MNAHQRRKLVRANRDHTARQEMRLRVQRPDYLDLLDRNAR